MSAADFKRNLLFYGGINDVTGSMLNRGNIIMMGNGSYLTSLTVTNLVVDGMPSSRGCLLIR
jgi:hypothetical protein